MTYYLLGLGYMTIVIFFLAFNYGAHMDDEDDEQAFEGLSVKDIA